MKQAELDASRARRLFEIKNRQERRQIEFGAQEAARAPRKAEKGFQEATNELSQVKAECQMWKDPARRAEEILDKEQTCNREGRIVLYL